MIKEDMSDKLRVWFGKECKYHVIKEDESCAMIWVNNGSEYSLARLMQIGGKLEISVDARIDKFDFNTVAAIMRRCIELA